MATMMLMAHRKDIMGGFTLPPVLMWLGWAATAVMLAAVIILGVSYLV